jgi:hypothetical protein
LLLEGCRIAVNAITAVKEFDRLAFQHNTCARGFFGFCGNSRRSAEDCVKRVAGLCDVGIAVGLNLESGGVRLCVQHRGSNRVDEATIQAVQPLFAGLQDQALRHPAGFVGKV